MHVRIKAPKDMAAGLFFILVGIGLVILLQQLPIQPGGELARRVQPAAAQQLVARGDLDENCEVAPGRDRHAHQRHLDARQLAALAPIVKTRIVEKHLRAYVISPGIDLGFEMIHAAQGVGGFGMPFGKCGDLGRECLGKILRGCVLFQVSVAVNAT